MFEHLRSWRHALSFFLSERLRLSRGTFKEEPAQRLSGLDTASARRVQQLAEQYTVCFEQSLDARSALRNYEYLDFLDRMFSAVRLPTPRPAVLCDAGCASFWYAAALAAFFRPQRLIGVDVEGYRRLRGGRSRIDYARGYLENLGQGEFVVADYRRYEQPADVITSFFPFLTSRALLAWRLPLSLLDPPLFFARVRANLTRNGLFFMVNHGMEEAALAAERCAAAGLVRIGGWAQTGPLSGYRSKPPQVSLWRAA